MDFARSDRAIVGLPVNYETAEAAGEAAVSVATPLANNEYKVQLAKVAVKRAAAGRRSGDGRILSRE